MNRRVSSPVVAMFLVFLLLPVAGCEEEPEEPDTPDFADYVNPNKPNANDLIVLQRLIGDADDKTTIKEIIDSGDGGFYFRGYYNGRNALGKMDQTGQMEWAYRSRYVVYDIVRLAELGGDLGNSVISVGGYDTDLAVETGYASLINSSGSLVNELAFTVASTDIWLGALAVTEASESLYHVVAVGGAFVSDTYYPYVAKFTVASDGTMTLTEEKVFLDKATYFLRNVWIDHDQSPALCYLQGDRYVVGTGYRGQVVYRMSDALDLPWTQTIAVQADLSSATIDGKGFLCSGDKLFMSGTTEIAKEVEPPSGGYWRAGIATCLTAGGAADWAKSFALSQYTDRFASCCFTDGSLYVTGLHSSFVVTESEREYGNALLLKIDPATGNAVAEMSFGDESYRSRFHDVVVRGTQAFAVGSTNFKVTNGTYQGWFVVIDLSGTPKAFERSPWATERTAGSGVSIVFDDLDSADEGDPRMP